MFDPKNIPPLHLKITTLHNEALRIAKELHKNEYLMIEVLQKIDSDKIYRYMKFKSLFQYATLSLGLSNERAHNFIRVARKASEVTKLQDALKSGEITLSKARKITSVVTTKNVDHWLKLTKSLSQRSLEHAVAKVDPKASVHEGSRFISETQLEFKIVVSIETEQIVKRVQDLLCQSAKRLV